MKRARGSALAPASFEALARVRRALGEQAAAPAPSPGKNDIGSASSASLCMR